MDQKQVNKLVVAYEGLIMEFSRKMHWLIKTEHSRRYQFAVHRDMENRTMERLSQIHKKLYEFAGVEDSLPAIELLKETSK